MSIVLDPAEPVAFRSRDDGPTYHLRVPLVKDRAKYRHAIRAAGGRQWTNLQLMAMARKALDQILPGEEGDAGRVLIDAYCEGLNAAIDKRRQGQSEETDAELIAAVTISGELAEIVNAIAERDQALANASADNGVYHLIAGQEAARMFLIGWDGLGEFKRGLNGPTEATLAQITSYDFERIAQKVEEMIEPQEARMGNSGSSSSGRPTGTDSEDSSDTAQSDH